MSLLLALSISISISLVDGSIELSGISLPELDAMAANPELARNALEVWVGDVTDGPTVLGSHEVDRPSGVLRFTPMFPFDSGRSYRVVAHVEGSVHEESITLPAPERRPSTTISAVYPTSGVLPENQLKLYVHFSAPMAGGDGLPYVRLETDSGEPVNEAFLPLGSAFWDPDRLRYTIFFDPGRVKQGILPNEELGRPLLAGEHYRLVLDPDWPDSNGLPLASGFTKEFVAGPKDIRPIELEFWSLTLPLAGSRQPIVVDFGEPLDHAILGRTLDIVTRDGNEVSGTTDVREGETQWTFVPDTGWQAGAYVLRVRSELEDLAGNRIGQPFEVDVFNKIDDSSASADDVFELPFRIRSSR